MERADSVEPLVLVSRSDLDSLIATVASKVVDPKAGIFGPESISWRINRESALFLGAGRAALLQLAHPWVATALEQHSSLMSDPLARFHGTFRVVFTMIFGSAGQAFAAARGLHALHTRIRGTLPGPIAGYASGARYEANFAPALRWVYATLVDSAVIAYECVRPALTEDERGRYYAESGVLAGLFGIPASALPESWPAFEEYMRAMCASDALGVEERARAMAQGLLAGAGSWVKPPRWYRALTTAWLPQRFREEFGLAFGAAEERAVEKARFWLPRVYRSLPSSIRFTGPYREACARLSGRGPGLWTRASNRFWIGGERMPLGE
jgi:uncharacterized protein (DUF2236 family)